jgi:hypothetical protein
VNGFLTFGPSIGCGFASNAAIPSPLAPNDFVAPFWDNWWLGTPSASVVRRVAGPPGSQTFTVEWWQMSPASG